MKKALLLLAIANSLSLSAQEIKKPIIEKIKQEIKQELATENKKLFDWNNFTLSGYGAINYYKYGKYDTDPNIKDKFDAERLNLYLGYHFTDKISLKTEIEFEHGGTGATIELDTQEEFGEYEQEIEKGGEVKLEQIFIDFKIRPYFNIRAGRMKLHFNLAQNIDRPISYFTTHRPEMENEILPLGWYENGVQFYGNFLKKFNYEFSITNGLDATGFSSRGWIKDGYQQRFEMSVGESLALTARVDYKFGKNKNTFAGIAAYINNTTPNRPKNDISSSAFVNIYEGHISYDEEHLRFNTVFLYGSLQNSEMITKKNASLSNNLGVKRTPVAKNMIGFSTEIGYEISHLFTQSSQKKLYPFFRFEHYDTMHKTSGVVVRKPRWQRTAYTYGVNWFVLPQIVVKAHYQNKQLGSEHHDPVTSLPTGKKQKENTFSMGIGFSF